MVQHYPVDLQDDGSVFFPAQVKAHFMQNTHHKPRIYAACQISTQTKSCYLVCLRNKGDIEKLVAHQTNVLWPNFENDYDDKSTGKAKIYSKIASIIRPEAHEADDSGNFNLGRICKSAGLSGKLTWAVPDETPVQGINHWIELWQYNKFCEEYKDKLLSLDDPKVQRMIKSVLNGLA